MRRAYVLSFAIAPMLASACGNSDSAPKREGEDESDAARTDAFTEVDATPVGDADMLDAADAADATNIGLTVSPTELVFSGVKSTKSAAQTVTLTNTGSTALTISSAALTGAAFAMKPSATPVSLKSGEAWTFSATFAPPASPLGVLPGKVHLTDDLGGHDVDLFGLSTNGEQGNNEPTFQNVVDALGYEIDVGGTKLTLGTGAKPIGDEVVHPLFTKAGPGPVTMRAVARYSPAETLPFGWYEPVAKGTPTTHVLATIALGAEQSLNPALVVPGVPSFDPGNVSFGLYVDSNTFKRNTYTQDALNTGPTVHATRVYPLKDRQGKLVANSFLLGFEDAANGDYQDYVFVITNVLP